jgi:hypothetical protein
MVTIGAASSLHNSVDWLTPTTRIFGVETDTRRVRIGEISMLRVEEARTGPQAADPWRIRSRRLPCFLGLVAAHCGATAGACSTAVERQWHRKLERYRMRATFETRDWPSAVALTT